MAIWYYLFIFISSILCSTWYFLKWRKHFDVKFSLSYMLFPLVMLGYLLLALAKDVGSAITANKIVYIGGCYMELLITLIIYSLCHIKLPRWFITILIAISTFTYLCVVSIGYSEIYYKSVDITQRAGATILIKEYGPLHVMFSIIIFLNFALSLGALIYAYLKKPEASVKTILLFFLTEVFSILIFYFGRIITDRVELIPTAFVFDAVIYLIILDRLSLYEADAMVADTIFKQGNIGYIMFDFKYKYLGSTRIARKYLPELKAARVDYMVPDEELRNKIDEWIGDFLKDEVSKELHYERQGNIFRIVVNYFYDGKRKRGYQIEVFDDTRHQQYLKTIEQYNKNLKEELAVKTALLEKLMKEKELREDTVKDEKA